MPNYRRRTFGGGYYFFTVITCGRRPFLTCSPARNILRKAWRRVCEDRPFHTTAICLLPDHLHCIWRLPEGDSNYSTRWRLIKAMFSREWLSIAGDIILQSDSRASKKELPVWQRRFWEHQIRDADDLERHCNYIHYNPAKHNYVKEAINWPWSSYRRFVRDDRFIDLSQENLDWIAKQMEVAE